MRVLGGVRCKPIPITNGRYYAGEDGSIWSVAYTDKRGHLWPERKLKPRLYGSTANTKDRGEYLCVNLHVKGVAKKLAVHRLVAEAWLDDYHYLLEVHHKNGNPHDNRPQNLECMTRAEHERIHGLDVRDVDIVNARYDFELHKDDARPNPFTRRSKPYRRKGAKPLSTYILQLTKQTNNLIKKMELK